MTNQDVSNAVTTIQSVGDLILEEVEQFAPSTAAAVSTAELLLDLAAKAVAAWASASGVPVTVENLQALVAKLNPEPLTPPTI
jgi:hypothetical protein